MKRLAIILLTLSLCCSCTKETPIQLVSFSDTGCANEQPVTRGGSPVSQLILEYSESGLVITRTNARMNCSIKNGGIGCSFSTSGTDIHFSAYEKDGKTMRCTCPVGTITSTISGLRLGRNYTLFCVCGGTFVPVSFTYEKGLKMALDADVYSSDDDS